MTCIICEKAAVFKFSSLCEIVKEFKNQGFCEVHNVINCSENKNHTVISEILFYTERDAIEFISFLSNNVRSYFNNFCSKIFADVLKIAGNINLKWYFELIVWYKKMIACEYQLLLHDIINDKESLISITTDPMVQYQERITKYLYCDIRNNKCKYEIINGSDFSCILQKCEWNRCCSMCNILFTTDYYSNDIEINEDESFHDYFSRNREFVCDNCTKITKVIETEFIHNLSVNHKNNFSNLIELMIFFLSSDVIAIVIDYIFSVDNIRDEIEKLNTIIEKYSHLKK